MSPEDRRRSGEDAKLPFSLCLPLAFHTWLPPYLLPTGLWGKVLPAAFLSQGTCS